jgi:proline dehydrogenase
MFRSFFIYISKAAWARKIVTSWSVAWKAASRFVAGEKLEEALHTTRSLNQKGMAVTLDHLGEHTTNPEEAHRAAGDILNILEKIDESGVRANVSLKLTQIGLALGYEICRENLTMILERAAQCQTFVRLDMEDYPWVESTLQLYREMVDRFGPERLGVVIQSYLYRSEADIRELAAYGARVRLCKGAYKEPPEVAYPKKKDVDANFDRLADLLIEIAMESGAVGVSPDGKTPPIPAIATHDDKRVKHVKETMQQRGVPQQVVEFQMLNGIRRDLQEQLVQEGFPVRIYVPYGTEWYPYFMRRLAERPANVWFFISNYFRR